MKISLLLQADYQGVFIAICSNGLILDSVFVDKMNACKNLMLTISNLLNSHKLRFFDLLYIVVNQGPAPFTTLRIVITIVNALHFAYKIPIVGVDALKTFALEYNHLETDIIIVLLNAFSHDVYFSIYDKKEFSIGWGNYKEVVLQLKDKFKKETITCIGNGVDLYKNYISSEIKNVVYLQNNPHYVSIDYVAKYAYQQWLNKNIIKTIVEPLYLKDQQYKQSI